MKPEAKVGLFVLLGLGGLFMLSIQLSRFTNAGKEGYELKAALTTVSGLDKNAKVKIRGVEVGFVKDVHLEGVKPVVTLVLYPDVKIPRDSQVALGQDSMLGLKFLELIPGKQSAVLNAGERVESERIYASFDETATSINAAANELKAFVSEMRATFDPNARENFQASIENFRRMTEALSLAGNKFGNMADEFKSTGSTINGSLPSILKKADSLATQFDTAGKTLNAKLPEMTDRFVALEKDLDGLIKENRQPLNGALKSIDGFFTNGTETLRKVDKYITKGMQSELEVGLRSEWMGKDRNAKSYFSVEYSPAPTRYYLVDVVQTKDFTHRDAQGNYVEADKHEKSKTLVSAQFGKRYDDMRLRAGLIESTGGIGVDYFGDKDRLKASIDLFDYSAVNDIRGTKPHLKASLRYTIQKHLNVFAGLDNPFNTKSTNVFAGAGITFVDDDLKYLMGAGATFVK